MKHPGAKFEPGDVVRIADRKTLDEFLQSWKLHHPLQKEQLAHAGQIARVTQARMYHGGDILYVLDGVPGIWHQRLVDVPLGSN
jgi:hypothetical protein